MSAIYSLFNLEIAKNHSWLIIWSFTGKKWDANEHQNARLVSITVSQFLNSTTSDVSKIGKFYGNSFSYKDFPARHAQCALADEKLRCLGKCSIVYTHFLSHKRHVGMMMVMLWEERDENFCVSSITFLMMKAQPCCRLFHFHQRWNIEHHSSCLLGFRRRIVERESN